MEYSLDFSERLIDAADSFLFKENPGEESARLILYLSLLSCEISIKALLETAGFTIKEITKRSHGFSGLTEDICFCDLRHEPPDDSKEKSAAALLAQVVDPAFANATVGHLLSAEETGASKYPSEIRYGELPTHFSPLIMLNCAKVVCQWAKDNIGRIHQSSRLEIRRARQMG